MAQTWHGRSIKYDDEAAAAAAVGAPLVFEVELVGAAVSGGPLERSKETLTLLAELADDEDDDDHNDDHQYIIGSREEQQQLEGTQIMTEDNKENDAASPEAPAKKTSVKRVVKRVSKKKAEPGAGVARPETPQEAISEQAGEAGAESKPTATPTPAAAPAPAPEATSRPERRVSSKKRPAQRSGSNVFAMFTQNQVAQFKEAFGFIDQDKDGIISKSDIRATFDALGRLCNDRELDEMASEAPGPINFTMFLSVFGERVQGTDDEDVVLQAFSRFDEGDGFCKEDK